MRTLILALLLAACGGSTAGMSGPTMSGKLEDSSDETPKIQSNDILGRDAVTKKAVVKHILISWSDLSKNFESKQDPRAQARSREEADALAVELLKRVRAGEDMDKLMAEYSEDGGSAKSGRAYEVSAEAKFVFEFKRLALRLNPDEAGLVMSLYGWHIMKRIE